MINLGGVATRRVRSMDAPSQFMKAPRVLGDEGSHVVNKFQGRLLVAFAVKSDLIIGP